MTHTILVNPRKLHLLAGDLERITRGWGPSTADLTGAPSLTNWRLSWERVPVLCGMVSGHPELADGLVATSQLFAGDFENGTWCRTMSRWYRLDAKANLDG